MKKTLAIVLVLCMLIGLFAGCNAGTPATTTASASTTAAAKTTAGAVATTAAAATTAAPEKENFNPTGYPIVDEKITVTGFCAGYGKIPDGLTADDIVYWKTLEEITNIHIDWVLPEADATVINLYFAAGDLADFFVDSLTVERVQQFGVEGGMFADISELIYDYMPHMVSRFEQWPMMKKVITQDDGAVYTIPNVRLGTTAANGQFYYRTDILAEQGLSAPTTVDELYTTLAALKEADVTGGYAPLLYYNGTQLTTGAAVIYFLPAFGGSLNQGFDADENGKVFYVNTSDPMRRYVAFMSKLYSEGILDNEQFTIDPATFNARVKAGQAVFMNTAANVMPEDCLPNDGNVYLDILPPLTSEWNLEQRIAAYNSLVVAAGGIKADSPYIREILRVLDCAYAEEEIVPGTGMDDVAVNSGPKGVGYTVDETNGTYTFNEINGATGWDASYYYGWNVRYGVYDMPYYSTNPNSIARERGMMTNNVPYAQDTFPSAYLKFEEFEKTAVATQETDIGNYYEEMMAKFITGVEPMDNWDAYVAEIEKMGIADVVEVYQNAYDRWMAL